MKQFLLMISFFPPLILYKLKSAQQPKLLRTKNTQLRLLRHNFQNTKQVCGKEPVFLSKIKTYNVLEKIKLCHISYYITLLQ
jgi:hypothetical protein